MESKTDSFGRRRRKGTATERELFLNVRNSPFRRNGKPHWSFPDLESFLSIIPSIFYGGTVEGSKPREWCANARKGYTHLVPRAEAMLNHFESTICQNVPTSYMSVAGQFPIVPAFLSGMPDCFRAKRIERSPTSYLPIRVFYGVASSCGLEDKRIERGLAVLAMVMQLSKTRPVELWTYNDGTADANGNYFNVAIKAATPYCLSELCYVLTSEEYAVKMTYGLEKFETGQLGFTPTNLLAAELGATENDLVLPHYRAYLDSDFDKSPVEWVLKYIEEHNGQ